VARLFIQPVLLLVGDAARIELCFAFALSLKVIFVDHIQTLRLE